MKRAPRVSISCHRVYQIAIAKRLKKVEQVEAIGSGQQLQARFVCRLAAPEIVDRGNEIGVDQFGFLLHKAVCAVFVVPREVIHLLKGHAERPSSRRQSAEILIEQLGCARNLSRISLLDRIAETEQRVEDPSHFLRIGITPDQSRIGCGKRADGTALAFGDQS